VTKLAETFATIRNPAIWVGCFSTEGLVAIGHSSHMRLVLVIVLALAVGLAGCVRVAAHQREFLAKPTMNPEADPVETKLDEHVHEYREGSLGGAGVGGGGCGCN